MKKAWYFFCPIYFDPETNEVENRNWLGNILWPLATLYHKIAIFVLLMFGYEVATEFPIKITGEKK
jgi:hypothetical protein